MLLIGPRQTGKSTLVSSLKPDITINLADQQTYIDHLREPGLIAARVKGHQKIFVDEDIRVSVYRTEACAEVDFIVEKKGEVFAIEAKATRTIGAHDLRGLKSFRDFYGDGAKQVVLYFGTGPLSIDGIEILPLQAGTRAIFS